jgi:hypothetical protein
VTAQIASRLAEILLMVLVLPVSAALYRQAALMADRLSRTGLAAIEGPEVGDLAPRPLRSVSARDWLFVIETCSSTPDVLSVLGSLPDHDAGVRLVVVPRATADEVHRQEDVQARVERLHMGAPPWLGVIDGESALTLSRAVGIQSGPLYVRVAGGLVLDKRYIKSAGDMWGALEVADALPAEHLEGAAWARQT